MRTRTQGEELNRSRSEDEEGNEDAVGDEEGEGRRCECGKTLLRKQAASAAVSPTSKHGRRRRRKKPPYGGEQRNLSGGTSDTAAPNIAAVPEIRVTGETDPEEERESSRELSSSTYSTGGAVDEGIYDGNSSSIESSIFGNKSSNSSSRKSSRDDTCSSREQRGSRRPSYLHTGDAISLMIIEGCELCQESNYCKKDSQRDLPLVFTVQGCKETLYNYDMLPPYRRNYEDRKEK